MIGAVCAVAFASACGGTAEAPAREEATPVTAAPTPLQYTRELVFVGSEGEPIVVAPFAFRAMDDGQVLHRVAQGWLSRGPTWDRFLDESATTTRAGGVWRTVPLGNLRLVAGGPSELESIRFNRAERRLRLELGEPLSDWNQGGDTRFRLLEGGLTVGSEAIDGPVLELLRVERTTEDGWPPSQQGDFLFLVSGDSLQLVMANSTSSDEPPYTMIRSRGDDQVWEGGVVRWAETGPLQEARREVPRTWSIELPEVELVGELDAVGYDVLLGPERGGLRAVEIRYTVAGVLTIQEFEWPVVGTIRHVQQ